MRNKVSTVKRLQLHCRSVQPQGTARAYEDTRQRNDRLEILFTLITMKLEGGA
jgi:hypothetical protein